MPLYHAIRRCSTGLQGPAIFWEYGDVQPYLFPQLVEYHSFDNILDAVEFIGGGGDGEDSTANHAQNMTTTATVAGIPTGGRSHGLSLLATNKARATTTTLSPTKWPPVTRVPTAAAAAAAAIPSPAPLPLRKRAPSTTYTIKPTTRMERIQRGRDAQPTSKDDRPNRIPTTRLGRILKRSNAEPPTAHDSPSSKKQRAASHSPDTTTAPTSKPKRKPRKPKISDEEHEARFEKGLAELKAFHDAHGHCNVPRVPRTPLYSFVDRQRWHYAYLKAGKKTKLTITRIQRLKELGFVFLPCRKRRSFDQMALEWFEYQATHNGEDPPKSHSETLHQWVKRIRERYIDFQQNGPEGASSSMTQAQIDKLTQWGFKWERGPTQISAWNTRFEELVEYKQQHGHTLVRQKKHNGLGEWVNRQRCKYRKQQAGEKSGLTSEQMQKLQDIGFAFEVSRGHSPQALCGNANDNIPPATSSRHNRIWKSRFLELVEYKQQHGHTLVPQGHDGGLGSWVRDQRRKYKGQQGGKQGGLTSDELQQLQNIDFAFEVSPGPQRASLQQKQQQSGHLDPTNDNNNDADTDDFYKEEDAHDDSEDNSTISEEERK